MAIFRTGGKRKNGIVKMKIAVERFQRSLSLVKKQTYDDNEEEGDSASVPDDVKEGHFAVVAVDGEHPKRFVVPLNFLTHPTFLRLLEQAAEEYGFDHDDEPGVIFQTMPKYLDQNWALKEWLTAIERETTRDGARLSSDC